MDGTTLNWISENITNSAAVVVLTIVGIIFVLLCKFLWWPQIKAKIAENKKKDQEQQEKTNMMNQAILYILKTNMEKLLQYCSNKGYYTDSDRHVFCNEFHYYSSLGGNTDGELLKKNFERLDYRVVAEAPRMPGNKNPDPKVIEVLMDFYNGLVSGQINLNDLEGTREFIKKAIVANGIKTDNKEN